jgi:hypothetical protein
VLKLGGPELELHRVSGGQNPHLFDGEDAVLH